jgi:Tfp pilus assembly protein PilV
MTEKKFEIRGDLLHPCESVSRSCGFTYVEVLISMTLLLTALLFIGEANMTSLQLIRKGKVNQRATLMLLEKIEQLRLVPIQDLTAGEYEAASGLFLLQWRVQDHTPYFGTKQIQCRVLYNPTAAIIVESIFYRSE